jgi:hypothetical protein
MVLQYKSVYLAINKNKLQVMNNTSEQYDKVIKKCKDIFIKKMKDYGSSWRILRPESVTDQIFIKANRIRSIEQKGIQRVSDDILTEYIGIINYCIIGLIQLELGTNEQLELSLNKAEELYDHFVHITKKLMEDKNHDYGEAWREMRVSSLTDLILMKIMRVKQIEDHNGSTLISEGIEANYQDMINYSVFALIKLTPATKAE